MGVLKNGVGRPSNETIRKRNILKIVCVILVVIIIGLICYILNDKGVIKINNNKTTKKIEKKETKKTAKTVEISNKDAEKVMENVLSTDWAFYTKYAGIDIFNKDLYKSLVAVNKTQKSSKNYDICSLYVCDSEQVYNGNIDYKSYLGTYDSTYSYDDVNITFNKLFKTGKLQKDVFTEEFFWERITYNKKENAYFKFTPTSGDGPNHIISEVYKAYEKEDTLHVIIVYETDECDEDNKCYININNNKIYLGEDVSDIVNKYGDEMKKYDFSFEKTKDGYRFIKSSKLK